MFPCRDITGFRQTQNKKSGDSSVNPLPPRFSGLPSHVIAHRQGDAKKGEG